MKFDDKPAPKYRDVTCSVCGQKVMADGQRILPHTLPASTYGPGAGKAPPICGGSSFRRRG